MATDDTAASSDILVVVENENQFRPLLGCGNKLAEARKEALTVLVLSTSGQEPDWLKIPVAYAEVPINVEFIDESAGVIEVLRRAKQISPNVVFLGLRREGTDERQLVSARVDPILQEFPCMVMLVSADTDWEGPVDSADILVPFWNDPNSRYAIDIALELTPTASVTAVQVIPPPADEADRQEQEGSFAALTERWRSNPRFAEKTLIGSDETQTLLMEAKRHDFLLLGASRGPVFLHAIFGDHRIRLTRLNPNPTIIAHQYQGVVGSGVRRLRSMWLQFLPILSIEERIDVYRNVRRAARPTVDYYVMMALSSSIASLGLILNNPAVVIGAMLVAPLMSAIIGNGMAAVQGDIKFLFHSMDVTVRGVLVAVGMGVLMGLTVIGSDPTPQMLSRASPSFLDLVVGLLSGAAAAYAICRKDVSTALPGVAVAVAMVSPLATAGIGIALLNWEIAAGAFLLFLANMIAIIVASWIVFASLGFKPSGMQEERHIKVVRHSLAVTSILFLLMAGTLTFLSVEHIRQVKLEGHERIEFARRLHELQLPARIESWKVARQVSGARVLEIEVTARTSIDRDKVQGLYDTVSGHTKLPVSLVVNVIPAIEIDGSKAANGKMP